MKFFFKFILLLTIVTDSFGQDGSDIMYFKVTGIDSSIVGKFVHIDFYRRSFAGRAIDTININIGNKAIRFIEKRKDNGYNNWFSQQYLQSVESVDGCIVRIVKSRLDSIVADSIKVTNFIEFYDVNNKVITEKSRQQVSWFRSEAIYEVLVHWNQR